MDSPPYGFWYITMAMSWEVLFHDEFSAEFLALDEEVQVQLSKRAGLLGRMGPSLGRPYVDTLKGSTYGNMKELRLDVRGEVWRVAFAFDPNRRAVVLVAGDKRGTNQHRFYANLISIADRRFESHLTGLKTDGD